MVSIIYKSQGNWGSIAVARCCMNTQDSIAAQMHGPASQPLCGQLGKIIQLTAFSQSPPHFAVQTSKFMPDQNKANWQISSVAVIPSEKYWCWLPKNAHLFLKIRNQGSHVPCRIIYLSAGSQRHTLSKLKVWCSWLIGREHFSFFLYLKHLHYWIIYLNIQLSSNMFLAARVSPFTVPC